MPSGGCSSAVAVCGMSCGMVVVCVWCVAGCRSMQDDRDSAMYNAAPTYAYACDTRVRARDDRGVTNQAAEW